MKNLLKFQLPTVSAYPEWKALQKLSKLGIKAPTPLAIISRGFNPANSESIIITESVEPNISIEEILESKLINDVKVNQFIATNNTHTSFHLFVELDYLYLIEFLIPLETYEKQVQTIESIIGTIQKKEKR